MGGNHWTRTILAIREVVQERLKIRPLFSKDLPNALLLDVGVSRELVGALIEFGCQPRSASHSKTVYRYCEPPVLSSEEQCLRDFVMDLLLPPLHVVTLSKGERAPPLTQKQQQQQQQQQQGK